MNVKKVIARLVFLYAWGPALRGITSSRGKLH